MTELTALDPLRLDLRGAHLIEASAGTGKTYTITTLYLRLLLETRLTVDQILVVTYTNAATAELRARVRRRLAEALAAFTGDGAGDATLTALLDTRPLASRTEDVDRLTLALHSLDEAAIHTIHGFCQRVLQEHAFESGAFFEAELISNQTALLDDVVRDFWVSALHDAPPPLARKAQAKLDLASLLGLAARVCARPQLEVLPAGAADADVDGAMRRWHDAFAAARPLWESSRHEVFARLASPVLKHSYRKPEARREWEDDLAAFFARGEPSICSTLEWLTRTKIARYTKVGAEPPSHPFFDLCEALVDAQERLSAECDKRVLALRLRFVEHVRRELARRKREAKQLFFDDLLQQVHGALVGPAGPALAARIASRYPAALIDEFQDTDPVQYEIFERVYRSRDGSTLCLIGDPKQSIYAFRGADIFSYIRAGREARDRHTLDVNRRSDPRLLRGINALFAHARPFFFDEIGFQPMRPAEGAHDRLGGSAVGTPPLQLLLLRRTADAAGKPINKPDARTRIARAIAGEIARFLNSKARIDEREIRPADIAVLCRTNAEALEVQHHLREKRVPSVLHGDTSVFLTAEAAELERVLSALAEPGDSSALTSALSTTILGLDSEEVRALQEGSGEWEAWVARFHDWHRRWIEWGFIPAFRHLLDTCDVQRRLLAYVDGERRLTNLLHLGELLQTESIEHRRRPLALVEWLRQMRLDEGARNEMVGEAAQIRLESDASALQLTTIHKSKGLEYPIVYCPFLFDGRLLRDDDKKFLVFHDRDDGDRAKLDVSDAKPPEHQAFAKDEALAENLRLLYVALTRARHHCTIVWGAVNECEDAALGYLLHRPAAAPTPRALAAEAAKRIAHLSDADIRRDCERRAAEAGGAIEVADLREDPAEPYAGEAADALALACRSMDRGLDQSWRTSSFSGLIAHRVLSPEQAEGVDRDESDVAAPPPLAADVALAEFPAGARMGTLIHSILEQIDFAADDAAKRREIVLAALRRQGVESKWGEPLVSAIGDVLGTPLPGDAGLRLADVARRDRRDEVEFLFPVGAEETRARLSGAALADLFERHGGPAGRREYVARLRELAFRDLRGHLRGFIDLVFRHEGRWYVVDYKSNRLGGRAADYRPDHLLAAMDEHHYFLQYHLYGVALHRHLRLRLPRYDYERHFGGVYYLFVRGMSPDHPRGNGVFVDRPSAALVAELSQLLGEGA